MTYEGAQHILLWDSIRLEAFGYNAFREAV
jgi:hypothetical protein